jgi:predicted permease
MWQRQFGGSKSALGQRIILNIKPYEIVGVAGRHFHGLQPLGIDVWIPIAAQPNEALQNRGVSYLQLSGRLKDGVRPEQARARAASAAENLARQYPRTWTAANGKRRTLTTLPAIEAARPRGPIVLFVSLLMTVVGLVLLIACANIANLLLARAEVRRKEMVIRLSLGAGRGRLLRQLLTENVLLSLLGGALALLLASWTTDLLLRFKPPMDVPIAIDLVIDARVLAFTLGIALLTAILFGLAPSLAATRRDLASTLKEKASGITANLESFRLRNILIGGQAALCMLLLAGAGLFLRRAS